MIGGMDRLTVVVVAVGALTACLAALLATSHEAEAAFPGKNGKIVYTKRVYEEGINDGIFSVNADGTGEKRLTNTANGYSVEPSYSADGTKIAWNRNADIWIMDADGTDKRRLTGGPADDGEPAFSPDGRAVAFTRYTPETGQRDIYIKSISGSLRRVTNDEDREGSLSFGPNGYRIAYTISEAVPGACGGCIYPSEVATVRTDGTDRKIVTDAPGDSEASDPDWSPDGRTLAYTFYDIGSEQGRIETVRADGTGQQTVFSQDSGDPTFSPDGTKIAFVRWGWPGGIWTINPDGTKLTSVIGSPQALETEPTWGKSPQAGR